MEISSIYPRPFLAVQEQPRWMVFPGDVDIKDIPFREFLAPLRQSYPGMRIAFIHGNHDADTFAHWNMLHDCGDAEVSHGKVVDMDGVRVAGLGGNFMGCVWSPPAEEKFQSKDEAMRRGSYHSRNGQVPKPALHAAIYPADLKALSKQRADILGTHEAPSCHPLRLFRT